MSLLFFFERLFDTPQQIEQQAREKRTVLEGEDEGEGDPPALVCRVCGYQGPERHYCPTCLADTMRPPRRTR